MKIANFQEHLTKSKIQYQTSPDIERGTWDVRHKLPGVEREAREVGRSEAQTFVPGWPVLSPADFFRSKSEVRLPFPLDAPVQSRFYVARSAIYHLFRALRLEPHESVLVPNYHSGNEVAAIRAAGAPIAYYSIDRQLQPDLDQLSRLSRRGARVLYVIHFIGWPQPMDRMMELCRERNMILVEDCALSLLSRHGEQPLGSFGDYAVYCLYKTLPVPNGGVLVQNNPTLPKAGPLHLQRCNGLSVAARTGELVLGWLRNRSRRLGDPLSNLKKTIGRKLNEASIKRVPVGDIGFDLATVDIGMSPICTSLLERFDYAAIRRTRRSNYRRMYGNLAGRANPLCGELTNGVCPLFFPILVPNKPAAAAALANVGIEATELWNYGDPHVPPDISADAEFLRKHVLELPIHQGLTESQVDYVSDQVLRLGLHF